MHERLYRCAGDIQFDDVLPSASKVVEVHLKAFSETCNYLQYQRPLTKQHPCFFAEVRSLSAKSVVTLGIAGSDISDDIHPGNWNATVGYRSTGRCYSSHGDSANTEGQKFGVGDMFGVMVTYFGDESSTVIFLKNGKPVATRYLFEEDHNKFLPTVALENGPIDLGLLWPGAVQGVPSYSEVHYSAFEDLFYSDDKSCPELVIQSPLPLSKDLPHYEVVLKEVSEEGEAPTIGIATCSPLMPPPTCVLLNDYFKWQTDPTMLKMQVGQRMGWGICYNPTAQNKAGFSDKQEQLVLCYVTIDTTIVYAKMMLQPVGGWYPIAMLHPYASKIKIDMESNLASVDLSHLKELFEKLLPESQAVIKADIVARHINPKMFRCSSALKVIYGNKCTTVALSRDKKGIHVIQFLRPLTPEQRYYFLAVRKAGDSSVVCMGVAGHDVELKRYPGRLPNTVGYHSRDGKLYYNDKDNGNMTGKRYGKGDTVGLEVEVFQENMSVVLFSKNGAPVGTRFLTGQNHDQFLPTIAICGNGCEVIVEVIWQNRISSPPIYSVTNVEHWCLPEGAEADVATNTVVVEQGHSGAEAVQAPYSLHRSYNHFEVELIDDFDESTPPPAIALCTASPFDPTPKSNFKQDFIRFWATGEAQKAVKKGDLMGWGMLYPSSSTHHDEEQLVICYLTINRDVALTRVMFQPPGGFYPVVLLPPGVDRVRLNFGATIITKHPFTGEAVDQLVHEAQRMVAEEESKLAGGADPEDWDSEENKAKYLKPVPKTSPAHKPVDRLRDKFTANLDDNRRVLLRHKPSKMANLVEMMMKAEMEKKDTEDGMMGDTVTVPGGETGQIIGDKGVVRQSEAAEAISVDSPQLSPESSPQHSNRQSQAVKTKSGTCIVL